MTEVNRRDSEVPGQHETGVVQIIEGKRSDVRLTLDEVLEHQRIFGVEYIPPKDEENEPKTEAEVPYEGYVEQAH